MSGDELAALAAAQIGVREEPPGSNRVKFNTWYYGREVSGDSYPWCMVFVQWVFAQAGVSLPLRTASCGALMRAAQAAGSTGSSHSVRVSVPGTSTARWLIQLSRAAPCQCLTPAGMFTTSPGASGRAGSPHA